MKKIVSLLVVITMVFSLVATFNIMSVSAFSTELYTWKYFDDNTDNFYVNKEFDGKYFGYTNSTKTKNVSYGYVEGVSADENESLLNVNTDVYTLLYNDAINFTKPVMNFSFKAYFPTVDETRRVYMSLSKKTELEADLAIGDPDYWNTNYGNVYITLNDPKGKVWCGITENAEVLGTRTDYDVEIDQWHDYSIRVYTHRYGEIYFAMFMDEKLIGVAKSTNENIAFDDIGIRQISMQMGSQDTYVKDVKLEMENYDSSYAPFANMNYFNTIKFDEGKWEVKSDGALNASSDGTHKKQLVSSTASANTSTHFYSSSKFNNSKIDVIDYAGAKNTLKVELTPNSSATTQYGMFQNSGIDITKYFPKDKTVAFSYTYDVNIPNGTEANKRRTFFQLSRNSGDPVEMTYAFVSNIENNKVWFNVSSNKANTVQTADADIIGSKDADTAYAIETDKWYKIIYVLNVTNTSDAAYELVAEGFITDIETNKTKKIFQATTTLYKKVSGTDYLAYSGQRFLLYANQGTENVTTYYDNLTNRICEENLGIDFVNLTNDLYELRYSIINRSLVTVEGNYAAETDKIIIAGYNEKNNLVAMSLGNTVLDTEKGIISHTWDIKNYPSICKVKAFMFDGITSSVPVAEATTLYVK